jgi:hypothetical protein
MLSTTSSPSSFENSAFRPQRLLRRLASDALLLERRPGVGKSSLLLLELPLSPLAGGTFLQEPVFRDGERRNLGIEGGLQFIGLLGLLLGRARPLLSLALLGLRPPEQRMELQVVVADGDHLCLPVGRQGARPLQVRPRLPQRLISVDEGRADPLEGGGARPACPSLSWSWSRRASARYDSQLSGVLKASASTSKATHRSRSRQSSAHI